MVKKAIIADASVFIESSADEYTQFEDGIGMFKCPLGLISSNLNHKLASFENIEVFKSKVKTELMLVFLDRRGKKTSTLSTSRKIGLNYMILSGKITSSAIARNLPLEGAGTSISTRTLNIISKAIITDPIASSREDEAVRINVITKIMLNQTLKHIEGIHTYPSDKIKELV